MKSRLFLLSAFCAATFIATLTSRADDRIPVLTAGSEVYSNVTVSSVSATDVYFSYASGMTNVKLKNLSPEWQKHFKYDPDKAKAAELKQAENKAKYHDQIIHQPVVHAPSEERLPGSNTPAHIEAVWRTDLPGALSQAQSEGKLVLLDFTGSDWCPWCIKFDQNVLSTYQFGAYAASKLVLVKLDFPHTVPQPDSLKRDNADLSKRFQVNGFPTYVLLAADGHELGRQVGYSGGGPSAFISELNGFGSH